MARRNSSKRDAARSRRRFRIRKRVVGTPERPRLVVHRSLRHVEVQIIDDEAGHSLVGLSTRSPDLRDKPGTRVARGHQLGMLVAARAKERGIERVVFDRAGHLYHGAVKAVADGAREGGLSL